MFSQATQRWVIGDHWHKAGLSLTEQARKKNYLRSCNLAMTQHLCGQAPDKSLPLVSRLSQLGYPFLMPHCKHCAAVLW